MQISNYELYDYYNNNYNIITVSASANPKLRDTSIINKIAF